MFYQNHILSSIVHYAKNFVATSDLQQRNVQFMFKYYQKSTCIFWVSCTFKLLEN